MLVDDMRLLPSSHIYQQPDSSFQFESDDIGAVV
jgi:hypothetical protein